MPSNFRFVSVGQALTDAADVAQTIHGNSLKPLAPANVRATRNAAGDLIIRWDRRSRIGGGMRPFTDIPLAEEREVYDVEVCNGADVVDSWRIVVTGTEVERPTWEILKDTKHLVSISNDGTVRISSIGSGAGGEVLLLSRQQIFADETNLVSFYTKSSFATTLPKNIGLLSESSIVDNPTGVKPTYGWARGSVGQILTMEEFNFSDALSSGLVDFENTRLTIKTQSNQISYYQDRADDGTPPYVSPTAVPAVASGAYRLYLRETPPNSANEVLDVKIEHPNRITTYTAAQQIDRFGSIQSTVGSVKVVLYQVSAIVGRGFPREAML